MGENSNLLPPSISAEECSALADMIFSSTSSLNTPSLRGRPVLIPYTKQAFVLGELQPEKDGDHEQVQIVTRKNEKRTVSLTEAKQWLLQKSSSSSATKEISKPTPTPTSSNPQQKSAPRTNMVDIQEEYHPDGTQATGNVVNVSSEFQALIESMGGNPMNLDAEEFHDDEKTGDHEDTPNSLSDNEYSQLSQRLDELARLEEMENAGQQQPTKLQRVKVNKKQSGGGGWNKGFLNQPSKKKAIKKKTPAGTKPPPESAPPVASTPVRPSASVAQTARGGVAFDMSQNEVQEIPSVPGTRSLSGRKTVATPSPTSQDTNRMLDPSVFSGDIQERPKDNPGQSPGILERPMTNERPSRQQQPAKPKKKLSRFAQERMR
jgi:hypothetical protein